MHKLHPYRGKLTTEDVVEGMICALSNAKRLYADAQVLLDAGRYPSACSLGILAVEEIGKLTVLRLLALGGSKEAIKANWKRYSSHIDKNHFWMMVSVFESDENTSPDFNFKFDKQQAAIVDNIKQLSFYSGCYFNKQWASPVGAVEELVATVAVAMAEILTDNRTAPCVEEIEIWIKHIKPVRTADIDTQLRALESWYQEMKEIGLSNIGDNIMKLYVCKGIISLDDPARSPYESR